MPEPKCKHVTSRCEKEANVEIWSKARASAHPLSHCAVDFPVELDVRTKPCRIECTKVRTDKCGKPKGCEFKVVFDFDFDARIKGPSEKRTVCPVRLDVEAEHKINCDKKPGPCPCPPAPCPPRPCPPRHCERPRRR